MGIVKEVSEQTESFSPLFLLLYAPCPAPNAPRPMPRAQFTNFLPELLV
ncbi:MAG: hypothetical protein V7K98_01170 [Nostoc sp.]